MKRAACLARHFVKPTFLSPVIDHFLAIIKIELHITCIRFVKMCFARIPSFNPLLLSF